LTVAPGAGCDVPGHTNQCTITASVGTLQDCSEVCPTGDAGCYFKDGSADQGNSCSPAAACFSIQTCNCLPGGVCKSNSDCLGQNQICDAGRSNTCISTQHNAPFVKHGNNGTVDCA